MSIEVHHAIARAVTDRHTQRQTDRHTDKVTTVTLAAHAHRGLINQRIIIIIFTASKYQMLKSRTVKYIILYVHVPL